MAKVKICGLSRIEDIVALNAALPDYAGFVFVPSKRQISFKQAKILRELLDASILAVGVFINSAIEDIAKLFNDGVIQIAQLHGNEDASYIGRLKTLCPKMPIIKAYRQVTGASYLLLDNLKPGSGKPLSMTSAELAKTIALSQLPVFVAGGINLNTVQDVLLAKPYAIDVSSGVEVDGKKDAQKILELVTTVRRFS
ncbi:MAG: phosphoribosylanthranilate isomerase [Coriobacteriales bacterium]|jgi:phosphoribosylanthranilate isomerase|nr:phosphoribosylanthranilate isomerase [Coriobacteriales bacterium]